MSNVIAISSLREMKTILKQELTNLAEGYVSIGFYLKYTRDNNLHTQEGFLDVYDFAQQTFNISRTYANRWMNANDKYSIDGNSPEIEDKYRDYGSSQLIEMMSIPEEVAQEIPPSATIKDIREVKQIIKEENQEKEQEIEQEIEVCDVAQKPVNTESRDDLEQEKNILKNILFLWFKTEEKQKFEQFYEFVMKKELSEHEAMSILAPAKFKVINNSAGRAMLQEKGIMIFPSMKKLTYMDLFELFAELFAMLPEVSAEDSYEIVYKEPLKPKEPEPVQEQIPKQEPKEKKKEQEEKEEPEEEPKEEIKEEPKEEPKEEIKEEIKEEQIPGQMEVTKDFKEILPEEMVIGIDQGSEDEFTQSEDVEVIEITEDVVQEINEKKIEDIILSGDIEAIKNLMIQEYNCPLNNPLKCPHKCNYDIMECAEKRELCWDEWLKKKVKI